MGVLLREYKHGVHTQATKVAVIHTLNHSKVRRLNQRLSALFSSKRGLSAAFAAGMVNELRKSNSSQTKHTSRIAKMGLRAWLGQP